MWWEEDHPVGRKYRYLAPDLVRDHGLAIDNVHVPYRGCQRLWSAQADERESSLREHLAWIDDCARIAVPTMVMHATHGRVAPEPTAIAMDGFKRLIERAEDVGISIALENMRCPETLAMLLESFPSPNLGLCFDVSHDRLWSVAPGALLARWGHRLLAVHLNDTDGKRDQHWLPGDGVIEFESIRAALKSAGFSGALMLEVVPKDKSTQAHSFLRAAKRTIERFVLEVEESHHDTARTAVLPAL